MDVREIDGGDPHLARRFWEIGREAEAAHRVYDFYVPWPTAKVTLREGRPGIELVLLAAFDGSDMVAAATLGMPSLDNLHLASVDLYVLPDRQRRGVGTELLRACEDTARAHGRRVLLAEACGLPGQRSVGQQFAESLGYAVAMEDGMKVVDLDETESRWTDLERLAAERSHGYRLVLWDDAVPEEFLADYCLIGEAFNHEAPTGELELEPEVWDVDRIRKREAGNRASGRREVATAAVAPDGTIAGLTEIVVNEHAPHRGFQSGTLVLPDHRGRRLGLAMKVANQRRLRARFPHCRILMTGNAGVNGSMNAVNDHLGYRLVERSVEMQRQL